MNLFLRECCPREHQDSSLSPTEKQNVHQGGYSTETEEIFEDERKEFITSSIKNVNLGYYHEKTTEVKAMVTNTQSTLTLWEQEQIAANIEFAARNELSGDIIAYLCHV